MQKKPLKQIPVSFKILLIRCAVLSFFMSGLVSAQMQFYVYASDLNIVSKNNSKIDRQKIWHYYNERPVNNFKNYNTYPIQYKYPPPIQKIGSNPFLK